MLVSRGARRRRTRACGEPAAARRGRSSSADCSPPQVEEIEDSDARHAVRTAAVDAVPSISEPDRSSMREAPRCCCRAGVDGRRLRMLDEARQLRRLVPADDAVFRRSGSFVRRANGSRHAARVGSLERVGVGRRTLARTTRDGPLATYAMRDARAPRAAPRSARCRQRSWPEAELPRHELRWTACRGRPVRADGAGAVGRTGGDRQSARRLTAEDAPLRSPLRRRGRVCDSARAKRRRGPPRGDAAVARATGDALAEHCSGRR